MSSLSEFIIIASPFIFGITIWIAKELYDSFKGDISELKKSSYVMRTDQAKFSVKLDNFDDKISSLDKKVDANNQVVAALDKRSGDTLAMSEAISHFKKDMETQKIEYGKIILILKKVVEIVRPKNP